MSLIQMDESKCLTISALVLAIILSSSTQLLAANESKLESERLLVPLLKAGCPNGIPDGLAILEDSFTRKELMLFTKSHRFWLKTVSEVRGYVETLPPLRPDIFKGEYSESLNEIPGFPRYHRAIASFNGLSRDDDFYNNLLVFSRDRLYRFRFTRIEVPIDNLMRFKVVMVDYHPLERWISRSNNVMGFNVIHPIRKSTLLMLDDVTYKINSANLGYPVVFVGPHPIAALSKYSHLDSKIAYRLRTDLLVALRQGGEVCFNRTCAAVHLPCNSVWRSSRLGIWLKVVIISLSSLALLTSKRM